MRPAQHLQIDGRTVIVTWLDLPFVPPRALTTQAYGICFTDSGQIVLVGDAREQWNLPGGHPEGQETLEQTLAREVWEEACAEVLASRYLGCQQIDDPDAPDGLTCYYQARFWARIVLHPFVPEHETTHRCLIAPDQFLATLAWGSAPTARRILELGIAHESTSSANQEPI